MKINTTPLSDLLVIEPDVFGDQRGFFQEIWQADRYREAGIDATFVQDNLSLSRYGVLRGLHFQNPNPQGKLVYVLQGEVFDVAVDLRRDSPTFGQWYGETLSADNHVQLWVPPGFAHGFCVTSEMALFAYKCSGFYDPSSEQCLLWNDPALGIDWPVDDPQISDKDAKGVTLDNCKAFRS